MRLILLLEAGLALKSLLTSALVPVVAQKWLSLGSPHHATLNKCAVMAVKFLVWGKQ